MTFATAVYPGLNTAPESFKSVLRGFAVPGRTEAGAER